ncbi:hypothetical protein LZG04_26995 [Saccharothrix sp. S26]|uniref:hypothetical protein n=1 Tax=Saccharothrix sp. S26 TaxID=2907215 RepID=UPI001F18628F|nr:hypothetical protein [Saccharothrix sp. S26]MCE6998420.1 hypothetical protein [Saccharothrix sp. S26]
MRLQPENASLEAKADAVGLLALGEDLGEQLAIALPRVARSPGSRPVGATSGGKVVVATPAAH